MNNKNYIRAKILILIPIIIFAINAICLGSLAICYFSTGSDVTAIAFIFAGSLSLILTTLPCLVISVCGTVFAARARKEGMSGSHKFIVIGVIEIAVYVIGVISSIVVAFITFTSRVI